MKETHFYIHFNLDWWKHSIPIHQSIITEQAVETIINNIATVIFDWNVELEIYIEPPENWWHIFKVLITTWVITLSVFNLANTELWSWIIEWITWKDTKTYWKNIWEAIKDTTVWFFSKNSHDLVEGWVCVEKFHDSYEVKNSFYKTAIANKDILWLWFCKWHTFLIDKNSFFYKTIELKKEKTSNKFIDKYHDLRIVSSINSEKEKNLMWQVKDKKSDERFWVNIWDEDFYNIYFSNNLLIREFKVRVRYYISIDNFWEEKIEKKEVIMVYEYNNSIKLMTLPKNISFDSAPYKLPENYEWVENQTNMKV